MGRGREHSHQKLVVTLLMMSTILASAEDQNLRDGLQVDNIGLRPSLKEPVIVKNGVESANIMERIRENDPPAQNAKCRSCPSDPTVASIEDHQALVRKLLKVKQSNEQRIRHPLIEQMNPVSNLDKSTHQTRQPQSTVYRLEPHDLRDLLHTILRQDSTWLMPTLLELSQRLQKELAPKSLLNSTIADFKARHAVMCLLPTGFVVEITSEDKSDFIFSFNVYEAGIECQTLKFHDVTEESTECRPIHLTNFTSEEKAALSFLSVVDLGRFNPNLSTNLEYPFRAKLSLDHCGPVMAEFSGPTIKFSIPSTQTKAADSELT